MNNKYSFSEFISTGISFIRTKIFYPEARLIRFPFYIRGKALFQYGTGFTSGHHCRFDLQGAEKSLIIGKYCQIGDNVHIVAHHRVVLGDHCLLASKIFISDTNHGSYSGEYHSLPTEPPAKRELIEKEVTIGNNVWMGENVCVLPGVHIADGCVIGANSVVTKDVEANTIVAGIPAKAMKRFDDETKRWDTV